MEFEILSSMMDAEVYALAIALYFLGKALKKAKKFKNTDIPLILGVISIIFVAIHNFAIKDISTSQEICAAIFASVVQGILCAAASVYVNQIFKQAKYAKENKIDEAIEETNNDTIG